MHFGTGIFSSKWQKNLKLFPFLEPGLCKYYPALINRYIDGKYAITKHLPKDKTIFDGTNADNFMNFILPLSQQNEDYEGGGEIKFLRYKN